MNGTPNPQQPGLERLERAAWTVGAVGAAACVTGFVLSREQFFESYLVGYIFWTGLALGSFALLMLQYLSGGQWGLVIQRMLEAGTRTFTLMALLFIPLLFGLHHLYEWTHPDLLAANKLLEHKAPYLNTSFFIGRAVFYFAVWIGMAFLLNKWSQQMDRGAGAKTRRKLQGVSGPGLVIYGLTATFAAVDWMMSLEPEWFSTIFGMMFIVGHVLATLALVILIAKLLGETKPLSEVMQPRHFHDLGNLLLAFVMLWAYLSISQYLIIWSGNLPEEITWYKRRSEGGWEYIALLLIVFNFALPFLVLLLRKVKKRAELLGRVALLILVMWFVNLYWMVMPVFRPERILPHWMDLGALAGIGGIWVAFFARQLRSRPVLPLHDERLVEAMEAGHGH